MDEFRLRVAILIGFHGFLRSGEFTFTAAFDPTRHLARRHVTFTPTSMQLIIPTSKTDPGGNGRVVTIAATNDCFCPVAALKRFLLATPLPATAPLFAISTPTPPWTQPMFATELRALCAAHNLRPGIFGHSLRIGGITEAAAAG
ncbi:hypothetical protein HDU96_001851, partial [Phlyctochytrium bullatum]